MKRIFALILSLLMVLTLMVGCSSAPTVTTDPTASNSTSPSVSPDTPAEDAEEPADTDASDVSEPSEISEEPQTVYEPLVYPMTEDVVELTLWRMFPAMFTTISDPNEIAFYQWMEGVTNIHWDVQSPPFGSETEQFNLMIVSEMYPNVVYGFGNYYNRGFDYAIEEDELILPLDDYTEYMPNLMTLMQDDTVRKTLTTDNGHLPSFPLVKTDSVEGKVGQGVWNGSHLRQDMLDEIGMAVPTTYKELETVMEALMPLVDEAPMWVSSNGFEYNLYAGFNITYDWFQIDGQVKFGPYEENYREYISLMADYYAKGYISPDFVSYTGWSNDAKLISNEFGIVGCGFSGTETLAKLADTESYELTAMPLLSRGEEIHVRTQSDLASMGQGACIMSSTTEDQIPLICGWFDYLYGEEGRLLGNYGIEGVTFEYDENGKPYYSGAYVEEAEANGSMSAEWHYLVYNCPGLIYWDRTDGADAKAMSIYELWNSTGDNAYAYPEAATMSAEESEEYATTYSDIDTHMSENLPLFIMGERPMSEWDSFVETLKEMDADTCLELKQAALDRYNQR